MYLEVANQYDLAELFGKTSAITTPCKRATHRYLERKWLEVLPAVQRLSVQGARLMALSYRNFLVGGAAFCYCSWTGEYAIINAGNLKLWKGSQKQCMEMTLLEMIDPERFNQIIGFAVYGEEVQPDPSGHIPRTLHPCPACRARMQADPRVTRRTRIYTFRPWTVGDPLEEQKEKFVREHMSFSQLLRIHARANGAQHEDSDAAA